MHRLTLLFLALAALLFLAGCTPKPPLPKEELLEKTVTRTNYVLGGTYTAGRGEAMVEHKTVRTRQRVRQTFPQPGRFGPAAQALESSTNLYADGGSRVPFLLKKGTVYPIVGSRSLHGAEFFLVEVADSRENNQSCILPVDREGNLHPAPSLEPGAGHRLCRIPGYGYDGPLFDSVSKTAYGPLEEIRTLSDFGLFYDGREGNALYLFAVDEGNRSDYRFAWKGPEETLIRYKRFLVQVLEADDRKVVYKLLSDNEAFDGVNAMADATDLAPLPMVLFDFDRAAIRPSMKPVLDQLAETLKRRPFDALNFRLEGHCDDRGDVQYNLKLGKERAASVARALGERGVAADRLFVRSLGKNAPVCSGEDETCRQNNRRVELIPLR